MSTTARAYDGVTQLNTPSTPAGRAKLLLKNGVNRTVGETLGRARLWFPRCREQG